MFYHLDGVIENELNSREQWAHCLADVTTEEPLVRSLAQSHSLIKVVLPGFRCALGAARWYSGETFLLCFTYFRIKMFGRCFKKKTWLFLLATKGPVLREYAKLQAHVMKYSGNGDKRENAKGSESTLQQVPL